MSDDTLKMNGIDHDLVLEPKDGRYDVPVKLSRRPDSLEAGLITEKWQPNGQMLGHPFLRLDADRLVLRDTTIEVFESQHGPLKRMLEEVNVEAAAERQRQAAKDEEDRVAALPHRDRVRAVDSRLDWS